VQWQPGAIGAGNAVAAAFIDPNRGNDAPKTRAETSDEPPGRAARLRTCGGRRRHGAIGAQRRRHQCDCHDSTRLPHIGFISICPRRSRVKGPAAPLPRRVQPAHRGSTPVTSVALCPCTARISSARRVKGFPWPKPGHC
jgi:hypothetical protein